jgi:hypothetical protein
MLIYQGQWTDYFDELSRQAEGFDTAIEVIGGELGYQVEVSRASLLELAFDGREGISISVAENGRREEMLRHVVAGPSRVEATDEPGVPAALMIEDAGGTRTLLRFAAPDA